MAGRNQDTIYREGNAQPFTDGGMVEIIMDRGADIDLKSVMLRLDVREVVTTAFTAAADSYYSNSNWIDRVDVMGGNTVLTSYTGRALAWGNFGRNTLTSSFAFLPTPTNTVTAGTNQVIYYMIDFESIDTIRPKDTILHTFGYAQTSLRVYFNRKSALHPNGGTVGAGSFSGTITPAYVTSREYAADRVLPEFTRSCYTIETDLSTASSGTGQAFRLSEVGPDVNIRGAWIEVYNPTTAVYATAANFPITRVVMGSNSDRWADVSAQTLIAKASLDYETIFSNQGGIWLDFMRNGETPAKISNARNLSGVSDPYIWIQNTALAGYKAKIHIMGYKATGFTQPARAK